MSNKVRNQPYFTSIDKVILKRISDSKSSIKIAMAWFTDERIKEAVIDKKHQNENIDIEILVDDNDINKQYFFSSENQFIKAGIKLFRNKSKRLLHDKFMVIDSELTIMGSYNYTKKAKRNFENIAIIGDADFCSTYYRRFEFLKGESYIDENILLLTKYPDFCQKLISTYYSFTKKEYKRYESKITLGYCYSHFNGLYNQISYEPGFIFSPKVILDAKLKRHEFGLPVTKKAIKDYKVNEFTDNTFSDYKEVGGNFDEMVEHLQENLMKYDIYFEHKIDTTYSAAELEQLIINSVDIIIEEEIWINNFELFVNGNVIQMLFEKIFLL